MSENDNEVMKRYGITAETKLVYLCNKYRYDNLNDAVNYAKARLKNNRLNDAFNDKHAV